MLLAEEVAGSCTSSFTGTGTGTGTRSTDGSEAGADRGGTVFRSTSRYFEVASSSHTMGRPPAEDEAEEDEAAAAWDGRGKE